MKKPSVFIVGENSLLMLWKSKDYRLLKFIKYLALYKKLMRPAVNDTSHVFNFRWRVNKIIFSVLVKEISFLALKEMF
jgi:hypothetical protein